MNIKMTTLGSTLALILAASASAQMTSILPGGRGNLYIGVPMALPGPIAHIEINPRLNLPAPLFTPSGTLTLAPAAIAALPVVHAVPALPIALALPTSALRVHLAAPAKDSSAGDSASRETLEDLFDGRRQPAERGAVDGYGSVRSGRHVSLPERDLEDEIGAY